MHPCLIIHSRRSESKIIKSPYYEECKNIIIAEVYSICFDKQKKKTREMNRKRGESEKKEYAGRGSQPRKGKWKSKFFYYHTIKTHQENPVLFIPCYMVKIREIIRKIVLKLCMVFNGNPLDENKTNSFAFFFVSLPLRNFSLYTTVKPQYSTIRMLVFPGDTQSQCLLLLLCPSLA